ncbi:MAG: 5'/3'-nucleotidase SurE [Deltaproteobacteria bacterium]|nr:5'/3'-nucleotidase SurE [Deltaproteobacteria bacterium]MDQ3295840.1 5'/3'-nucleotidase SurE [Myxococcota bacterium]
MPRPLVLCSNDDGIESPHLGALADMIEAFADVLVVAPERQRSAASHAITLHKPLRLTARAPNRYSLSGTPVDCVYLGILKLCDRKPSVVVSGVNDGFNLGSDVFYSGTVAAAVEGALRGAAGIACSLAPGAANPDAAIRFAAAVVRAAIAEPIPPGTVLNVNMPGDATDTYQWTTLGRRLYDNDIAERQDPRGRPYYWVGGGPAGHEHVDGTDCVAIAQGRNSITPMHLDLTDRGRVATPPWVVDGFRVMVGSA